jgi:antitoxin component YwqK of YwqJK toxin-antitoxin module
MKNKMKRLLSISIFSVSVGILCGQTTKNLTFVNSSKIIQQGIDYFENQRWEEAEQSLGSVPVGDTLYDVAQYELAYTYTQQKRYDEALEILERLSANPNVNTSNVSKDQLYTLMANTYSENNQWEKALETYNTILRSYPYGYNIYFNKGVVYAKMEDYIQVEACAKMAIFCNPTHQTSHYLLGMAYLHQGYFVQGILALNYAVLLNPTSNVAIQSLQALDQLYMAGFDTYYADSNPALDTLKAGKEDYKRLEQLVQNNFSLLTGFKSKSNINHIIVRQNQLIFDNLNNNVASTAIENQLYVPTFKMLMQTKKDFNTYSYLLLRGTAINNHAISNQAAKMKKEFTALYAKIKTELSRAASKGLGRTTEALFSYVYDDDYYLESFGEYSVSPKGEKIKEGIWTTLNRKGGMEMTGTYVNGIPNGVWNYYTIKDFKMELTYKNDKKDGVAYSYFINDDTNQTLYVKMDFLDDEMNGISEEYNRSGVLIEKAQWKDGLYEGAYQSFYPQGGKKEEGMYKAGELIGNATVYYVNGNTSYQMLSDSITNKIVIKQYYPDGMVEGVEETTHDLPTGEWISYYPDGTVSETKQYDDAGKETGVWLTYHRNGTLSIETPYENGNRHGDEKNYASNGSLIAKTHWDKGYSTHITTYNTDGTEREKIIPNNKQIIVDLYSNEDTISYRQKRISCNDRGEKQGILVEYAPNGVKIAETEYKNNLQNGIAKTYFPNGKLQTYQQYKDDALNGFSLRYYPNDTLAIEANYIHGQLIVQYDYYMDGSLHTVATYNTQNEQTAEKNYFPTGQLSSEKIYKSGLIYQSRYYNDTGKCLGINQFINGNGIDYSYYFNGEVESKRTFRAGSLFDTAYFFDYQHKTCNPIYYIEGGANGVIKSTLLDSIEQMEGNYLLGYENGNIKYYYFNGVLNFEAMYEYGQQQGISKYYYLNGKLYDVVLYDKNQSNGLATYYAPDGETVEYQLKYSNDRIYAYSYRHKNHQMTAFKPMDNDKMTIVSYYPNGVVSGEVNFEKGLYQRLRSYYPNGKICFDYINVDDSYHGEYTCGYENGNVAISGAYYYDLPHGTTIVYYENGHPQEEIQYYLGMIHGTVKRYDKTGTLIETQRWFYDNRIQD